MRATGRASKLLPRRPRDASAALALVARGGARRVRRRQPPGRPRTRSHLPHAGDPRQFPPPAGGGPAGDAGNRVAQRRHPDGAQRRRSRWTRSTYSLALCRAGRPHAPDLGDRTGSRSDRDPAGGNPGNQPPGAAPRPRPRKPGRWAASRPGTAPASCGSWSRSSPVPIRCTSATPPGSRASRRSRLVAGSQRGSLRRAHRRQAPGHAREPGNREGRTRPLRPGLGSRNLLTAAGRAWPVVQTVWPVFRQAGDPPGLPWHYDCAGAHVVVSAPPPMRRASRQRRNR